MAELPEAFGELDRKLMWDVLGRWVESLSASGARASQISRFLESRFTPTLTADAVRHMRQALGDPYHLSRKGWIIGRSLTRENDAIPVLTLEFKLEESRVLDAAFRVAIFRFREDGTTASEGWRFEQAEVDADASHPYAHAQAVVGWTKSTDCLLHPSYATHPVTCNGIDLSGDPLLDRERKNAQLETLVKHPAIPMLTQSLTGLAIAVALTLYGSNDARALSPSLTDLRGAPDQVVEDLQRLGLSPFV